MKPNYKLHMYISTKKIIIKIRISIADLVKLHVLKTT